MAGKMDWDRVRKVKAVLDRGSERLDDVPEDEAARRGRRSAAKDLKKRDTVGQLKRDLRKRQHAKPEIVDPAAFRQRGPLDRKR